MTALLLTAVLLLGLCGCSLLAEQEYSAALGYTNEDFRTLLQGNLDELYLGKFNEDYIALLGSTREERQANYLAGLEHPADYFCYYFAVESPTEEYTNRVIDLYKEIYSHAKYTVSEVSQLNDTTYVAKVTISTIDIIELAVAAINDGGLDHVYNKYTPQEIHSMSIEDYAAYQRLWADELLKLVKEQLPNMGYCDEQTISVQIILENDAWCVSSIDLRAVDTLMVKYP